MFQVLLILSIAFSIYSVVEATTCAVGWTSYGNNCYKFALGSVTWPVCQSICADLNAMMLCITDESTNAWLYSQTGDNTWIGLSDIDNFGTYTWAPGCPSTYTNWDVSQPDRLGIQNYAYFYMNAPGKWDNSAPQYKKVCACERVFDFVSE